ncbi:alpha-tubulin N-acetyltransferase 1-like isoform X1 [Branchiostoma lanceolatum]|uniref:alpha-tubulin N-acetyltransferase 1-like isoform X1 n=1 Tax=Branchiostoma lanceolatum TaxID=7740 RepID=UPI003456AC25
MEFPFNIHGLFGEEISLVDSNLAPFRKVSNEPLDQNLAKVIDDLGEASAKAQGLHGPITATYKLRNSDHRMYVLKDGQANSGKGAAVGFIKVGTKKLFILDHHGAQVELTPLCVLDFYVHESRQRTGCGHKLFQHMLKMEKISPQHLAIDRPSNKFTKFLKKHYGLSGTVPQVNNFVVFEGFFRDNPATRYGRKQSSRNRPPLYPYRREGSTMSSRQRGSARNLQQEKAALQNIAVNQGRPSSTGLLISRFQQHEVNRNRSSSLGNLAAVELSEDRRMGAQASRYSRYAQDGTQGRRASAQNLAGSTAGQAGSTAGLTGLTAGQAGSTAGQAGSTAGQAGSTAGLTGLTAGLPGSIAGQAGSTAGQPGSTAGQPGSTAGYMHYRDITTRNGHLKVSSQQTAPLDRQRIPDNKAVVSGIHPPSAKVPAANIGGCSSPGSPSLRSDAVLKEGDLSYTLTAQQARRENSFWNVMGVPTTGLKDSKNNQRANNIW